MKNFFKLFVPFLGYGLFFSLLIGFALLVSYHLFVWAGYPVSGDAPQHLFRLRFVNEFFPNYHWIYLWAGGMPMFLWYPVAPFLVLSLFLRLTNGSPEFILTFASVLAVGLAGVGVYLLTWELTRNRIASFLAGFLYIILPSSWVIIHSSVYARAIATPLMVFALWAFVKFWKAEQENKFLKSAWILTVAFLGLTVLFHFAVGFVTHLFVLIFGLVSGGKKIWQSLFKLLELFLVSAFLSISFWLPLLIFKMPGFQIMKSSENIVASKVAWKDLFFFNNPLYTTQLNPSLHFLPFFVGLALFIFLVWAILFKRNLFSYQTFKSKALFGFLGLFIITLIYAQFPIPVSFMLFFYTNVLPHLWTIFYYPLFLAPVIAILWAGLLPRRWQLILILPAMGGIIFWFFSVFPSIDQPKVPYRHFEQTKENIFFDNVSKKFIENQRQFNWRLGTDNFGILAGWFNNNNLYLPQTREYSYLGILKPDWYFYLTQAVWNWPDNYEETDFLLDWWGIKQFLTGTEGHPNQAEGKFEARPRDYLPLGQYDYDLTSKVAKRYSYKGFQYQKAAPILSLSQTPTVLVIGDKTRGYNFVFRSLAYANLNSQKIIPAMGEEVIDSYSLEELQKFPIVFLYNYRLKNQAKADKLLRQYVEGGGRLFVEANKIKGEAKEDLEILPVDQLSSYEIEGNWNFQFPEAGFISQEVLKGFSEPVFDNGPWGVLVANKLKKDAKILLSAGGKPILVKKTIGQGEVIWSGLNLPFHIVHYQNEVESNFLGQLLGANQKESPRGRITERDLTFSTDAYQVDFINPQKRKITILDSQGGNKILFKEFYFPNWKAFGIKNGQKIPLKIYPAGPEFMLVNLEEGVKEVFLEYKNSLWQRGAFYLSLLSWLLLLFYAVEGKKAFLSSFVRRKFTPQLEKVGGWWEKEEE